MMPAVVSSRSTPAAHPLNIDPVVPVVGRMIAAADLKQSLKTVVNCVDSTPLLNVSVVSAKSIPYAHFGDRPVTQEFDNGLSCRVRYGEAAFMALASVVYNVVFSAIFTVLTLVTLGQLQVVRDQMSKQWIHAGLAVAALGIGITGVISPAMGINANFAAVLAIGGGLLLWARGDVLTKVAAAYQQNSAALKAATLQGLGNDRAFFNREFVPFFNYLDSHLNDQMQTTSGLRDFTEGASRLLPNISIDPTDNTPGLVLAELKRVFLSQATASASTP